MRPKNEIGTHSRNELEMSFFSEASLFTGSRCQYLFIQSTLKLNWSVGRYGTECAGIFIIVQLTLFTEYVPSKMPVDRDALTLDTLDCQYSTHQDTSDDHVACVCVHCLPCHSVSNITASLCMEVLPLWRPNTDWARVLGSDGPSPATHRGG